MVAAITALTSALVVLPLPPSVAAAPSISNDTIALKPWEVTVLNTHQPSGRAGNPPYDVLYVSISDPNTINLGSTRYGEADFPPSTANCTIRWNAYTEDPFGQVTPCDGPSHGRWTVEVQKANATGYGPSGTRDFKLRFVLEESMILNTGIVSETFVGVRGFALGDNLSGSCGGSGVCGYGLRNGEAVLVEQELQGTVCLSGTCDEKDV